MEPDRKNEARRTPTRSSASRRARRNFGVSCHAGKAIESASTRRLPANRRTPDRWDSSRSRNGIRGCIRCCHSRSPLRLLARQFRCHLFPSLPQRRRNPSSPQRRRNPRRLVRQRRCHLHPSLPQRRRYPLRRRPSLPRRYPPCPHRRSRLHCRRILRRRRLQLRPILRCHRASSHCCRPLRLRGPTPKPERSTRASPI